MTGDAAFDVPTGPSCGVCGRDASTWLHHLDPDKAGFTVHGKTHVWAQQVGLCERCEQMYRAGDDAGLVAVHERTWETTAEDVEQGIRRALVVLRAADLGAVEVARWLPPGAAELAADGFVPVEYLSGAIEVELVWPLPHRRSVPETRAGMGDDDGLLWLVRSPWPAVPLTEAIDLMWQWVEQPDPASPAAPYDSRTVTSRSRDFLGRDEAWVQSYRRSLG